MKKLVSVLTVIAGIGLFMFGGCGNGGTFTERAYASGETKIMNVVLDVSDREVEVAVSSDNQVRIDYFESEKEYYVNMCIAWFIAECFTKKRDKTLNFLQSNKLNAFTINKAIQKCRDSFRVSETDKEMLLRFKRN